MNQTYHIPETFSPKLGVFNQRKCWYLHRISTNETWWIQNTKLKNQFLEEHHVPIGKRIYRNKPCKNQDWIIDNF